MEPNFKGNYVSMTTNSSLSSVFHPDIELLRSIPKMERNYENFCTHSAAQFIQRDGNIGLEQNDVMTPIRTRDMSIHSNISYQSPQTNLEKLFSHATEVKGDLESVINALVGIIGPGNNETPGQSDQDALRSNNSMDMSNINQPKQNFFPNQYSNQGNYVWPTKGTPSVNVENVLKIVRANKINKEKYHVRYDSSQSSESSKEKIPDKLDYPVNSYEYNMRSLLSDPGYVERRNQSMIALPNRRKHKVKYHSNNNTNINWAPTDISIKRSKSLKSGSDVGNEFIPGQISNIMSETSRERLEGNSRWVNSAQHSVTAINSDSRELFNVINADIIAESTDRTDGVYYKQIPNYSWSPNKDVSVVPDESSCSSFSMLSQNQMIQPHNQGIIKSYGERNLRKDTPSLSVSDSEGSTEPQSPSPVKRIPRLPSLGTQLRPKEGQYELLLINQPEQHHRARYMTEGSRGAVKDRSGNGFPTIQLIGWKKPATLQIFVGTEEGRVKPHSFYQACKVSGKQVHSCKERMFDGTGLIEIQIETKETPVIVLDCIGILKLRNVDVERRAGIQRMKLKSTMARLAFRVNLPHGDGFFTCLQVISDPILCTQPVGSPEIGKMSLCEGTCKGNMELFIIGKNIVKSCKVLFQDYSEHKGIIWQAEARLDVEYLHQSHLICTVPPYCDENLRTPVTVQVVISCNGRLSEPRYFTYLPDTPTKSLELMDSYDIEEWKILKSDYANIPSFPIDNCPLNSELANTNHDEKFIKTTSEMIYDKEYNKPNEPSHQIFPTASIPTNYNAMCLSNKSLDHLQTRTIMDWTPCSTSNDITISSISTPSSFDIMSNSLDSNIQNDFMLQFSSTENTNLTNIQSESLNTLIESNDILTHL